MTSPEDTKLVLEWFLQHWTKLFSLFVLFVFTVVFIKRLVFWAFDEESEYKRHRNIYASNL